MNEWARLNRGKENVVRPSMQRLVPRPACGCGWQDIDHRAWGTCGTATPPPTTIERVYDFTPGAVSEWWVTLGGALADNELLGADGRYAALGEFDLDFATSESSVALNHTAYLWTPYGSVAHNNLENPGYSTPAPPTPADWSNRCLRRDMGEVWVPLWMDGFGVDGAHVQVQGRDSTGGGGVTLECRGCFRVAPPERVIVRENQVCRVAPWPTGLRHTGDAGFAAALAPCVFLRQRGNQFAALGSNIGAPSRPVCFSEWPLAIITQPRTLTITFSVARPTVRRYYRSSIGLTDRALLSRDFNPWGRWVLVSRLIRDANWWGDTGMTLQRSVIDSHLPAPGSYPGGMTKAAVNDDIADIFVPAASPAVPRVLTLRYEPSLWPALQWPDEQLSIGVGNALQHCAWGLGSTCTVHTATLS